MKTDWWTTDVAKTPLRMAMTRDRMTSLLTTNGTAYLDLPDGRTGILSSVMREDGSGKSFILTVNVGKGKTSGGGIVYVPEVVLCRIIEG